MFTFYLSVQVPLAVRGDVAVWRGGCSDCVSCSVNQLQSPSYPALSLNSKEHRHRSLNSLSDAAGPLAGREGRFGWWWLRVTGFLFFFLLLFLYAFLAWFFFYYCEMPVRWTVELTQHPRPHTHCNLLWEFSGVWDSYLCPLPVSLFFIFLLYLYN